MNIYLSSKVENGIGAYAGTVNLSDGYTLEIAHYRNAPDSPGAMLVLGAIAVLSQLRKPKTPIEIKIHTPTPPAKADLTRQEKRLGITVKWVKSSSHPRTDKLLNWVIKKKCLWITLSKDENAVFQFSSGGLLSIVDDSNVTINENDHNICTFVLGV